MCPKQALPVTGSHTDLALLLDKTRGPNSVSLGSWLMLEISWSPADAESFLVGTFLGAFPAASVASHLALRVAQKFAPHSALPPGPAGGQSPDYWTSS